MKIISFFPGRLLVNSETKTNKNKNRNKKQKKNQSKI